MVPWPETSLVKVSCKSVHYFVSIPAVRRTNKHINTTKNITSCLQIYFVCSLLDHAMSRYNNSAPHCSKASEGQSCPSSIKSGGQSEFFSDFWNFFNLTKPLTMRYAEDKCDWHIISDHSKMSAHLTLSRIFKRHPTFFYTTFCVTVTCLRRWPTSTQHWVNVSPLLVNCAISDYRVNIAAVSATT